MFTLFKIKMSRLTDQNASNCASTSTTGIGTTVLFICLQFATIKCHYYHTIVEYHIIIIWKINIVDILFNICSETTFSHSIFLFVLLYCYIFPPLTCRTKMLLNYNWFWCIMLSLIVNIVTLYMYKNSIVITAQLGMIIVKFKVYELHHTRSFNYAWG